jgi:hypothetical protein
MQAQRPLILTISFLAILGLTAFAFGQRGMGQPQGVAQQAEKPAIQTLQGTVQKVITEECVNTTGRYRMGTHFILKTEDGERNVHLGPAAVSPVKTTAAALSKGQAVTVKVFRTDRMPKGHYNAQQIETEDQTLLLRDDTLRPAQWRPFPFIPEAWPWPTRLATATGLAIGLLLGTAMGLNTPAAIYTSPQAQTAPQQTPHAIDPAAAYQLDALSGAPEGSLVSTYLQAGQDHESQEAS